MFWILWYLKWSPEKDLLFFKDNYINIDGYIDADWAGDLIDRNMTSSYFIFVSGNLVIWRNKRQKVMALSSVDAELEGMAKGMCDLMWLKRLMIDIGFAPQSEMNLLCDNKAAIDMSHNPVQYECTKHIEVDRHFIKQNLEDKVIQFPSVKSEKQLADIFTRTI